MSEKKYNINITGLGLLIYGCMIFILFWGFAQAEFEPESILGQITNTKLGRIGFSLSLCIPFYILEKVLDKYGYKTTVKEKINDT